MIYKKNYIFEKVNTKKCNAFFCINFYKQQIIKQLNVSNF